MTLALAPALVLALVVAVGTSTVEAQTSDGPGPNLSLEPSSGPPGTPVTAVVTGFAACVPFGDDVGRRDETLILWDGTDEVGEIELDLVTGGGDTSFPVPADASLGEHRVVARCVIEGASTSVQAVEGFVVEPPAELRTVVPNVLNATREDATAAIVDADLEVGRVIGDGEVVRTQDPLPNTEVDPGTSVDLDLGTVAPESEVTVPDLVGGDLGDVPAVLAERGLVLGGVRGDGDVVRDQEPAAGTRVLSGSVVNVSVEADVLPEVLVAVPDVDGLTADEARAVVEAAGLVLVGGLEGGERVAAQIPPPDALVALGSLVTVSAEITSTPAGSWRGALAVVVALLVAAWLARRLLRSRRDRRWVRRHVRVERGPTAGSGPVVHEDAADGDRPTRVVRLEPHLDPSTPTLEEVGP